MNREKYLRKDCGCYVMWSPQHRGRGYLRHFCPEHRKLSKTQWGEIWTIDKLIRE